MAWPLNMAHEQLVAKNSPEQLEVDVQLDGAQASTLLVRLPSWVSVAVAPVSHSALAVGSTPLAQAA